MATFHFFLVSEERTRGERGRREGEVPRRLFNRGQQLSKNSIVLGEAEMGNVAQNQHLPLLRLPSDNALLPTPDSLVSAPTVEKEKDRSLTSPFIPIPVCFLLSLLSPV